VPPALRRWVWPALSGAAEHAAAAASCHGTSEVYRSMCAQFEAVDPQDEPKYSLEKDLARTFPAERTLINSATGAAALRRVVGAVAMLNIRTGYCQSMCLVAGHVLVALGAATWTVAGAAATHEAAAVATLSVELEEDAFWLLWHIAEHVVPLYWAEPDLPGLLHHTSVLETQCYRHLPATMEYFADVPMALVGVKWLGPLFALTLPAPTLHRLWDQLLLSPEGAQVLLASALAILRGIRSDVLQRAPQLALQVRMHDTKWQLSLLWVPATPNFDQYRASKLGQAGNCPNRNVF
jgi:hypothetical protein